MHGAASGKGQWLREWEYHIHGVAVRGPAVGAAPLAPVTGFTVTVGHIKPRKDPYALGASINVANPNFNAMINGYQAQFARWANSSKGSALLERKE
jgi:hypothetical protein